MLSITKNLTHFRHIVSTDSVQLKEFDAVILRARSAATTTTIAVPLLLAIVMAAIKLLL